MAYIGDFRLGDTFDTKFCTVNTSGAPTTLAGVPVISAYVGNSLIEFTTGVTLTVDFDARTGLNNVRVVATGANGFATGSNYQLVITTGTVGGTSVVGYVVAEFSIEARSALMPATAARTLVVDAAGLADATVVKLGPTGAGTAQTARDIGASVLLSSGAGTGQLDFTAGVVKANAVQVLGGAMPAVTVTGVPKVDVADWLGGAPNALIAGRVDGSTGAMAANVVTAAAVADGAIDRATFAADTGLQSIRSGTAQAGAAGTVTLDAGASAVDSFYNDCWVYVTGGTGVGQARLVTAYVGATKVATISPNWATNPDATSTFAVHPMNRVSVGAWLGTVMNGLIAGRVDANAQVVGDKTGYAIGVGGIANTAFAVSAIDAAAIATDAIGSLEFSQPAADKIWSTTARTLTSGVIKKNTAFSAVEFLMVDSTDHVTPKTGLTLTGTRSIDGGAFAAITGTLAEVGNGIYQLNASAADLNGGVITFRFTGTAADAAFLTVITST